MQWYNSLDENRFAQSQYDCLRQIYTMNLCLDVAPIIDSKWSDQLMKKFEGSVRVYQERGGQLPMQ